MSNAAFKKNFSKLLERAGEKADMVARKCALDVSTSLIMKSPVDTGRFRANWQLGLNTLNTATNSAEDKTGAATQARIGTALTGYKTGDKITITNSLPYAQRLEYGWSQSQAPNGMVRITVVEFNQWLRKAIRDLGMTPA